MVEGRTLKRYLGVGMPRVGDYNRKPPLSQYQKRCRCSPYCVPDHSNRKAPEPTLAPDSSQSFENDGTLGLTGGQKRPCV